jgi:hypothetical protein
MSDMPWDISEEQIGEMFPDLKPEERKEAAANYSQYLRVISNIYDQLKDEGKLEELKLRLDYEKRNNNKPESHNGNDSEDELPTPGGESNEFIS